MATEAQTNKCITCRWGRVCNAVKLTRKGIKVDVFLVACRAVAPGRSVAGWPVVLEDDECGEWTAKPAAPAPAPAAQPNQANRTGRADKPRGPQTGGGDRMAFDGDVSMEEM
jgi:hypothetical protein